MVFCMSLATVLLLALLFAAHLLLLGAVVTMCLRGSHVERGGKDRTEQKMKSVRV